MRAAAGDRVGLEPRIPDAVGIAPFDGAHPVRLALVVEIVDVLRRHGYQRAAGARSLAGFLRHLNGLVRAYEIGS